VWRWSTGALLWLAAAPLLGAPPVADPAPQTPAEVARSQLVYGPMPKDMLCFGQWVVRDAATHEYLMYVSISSAIVDGQPTAKLPGDRGTYNAACKAWWADRIWLVRHAGDGIRPTDWSRPQLQLTIGGPGESALIGDPCVVHWQGQWHMYYEGTDQCDGNGNRIFHATAAHATGPWHKRGRVEGLAGALGGSGLSWPTVLIDGDSLLLFYTDGRARLLCARGAAVDGQTFQPASAGAGRSSGEQEPVSVVPGEWVNRGQVVKDGAGYLLVYDAQQRTKIKLARSNTPLRFPQGKEIMAANPQRSWENTRVGLPCLVQIGSERRVYYTGESNDRGGGAIGVISF
jgi:hypothetical protein